eukprot:Pgem_evm1s6077
MEKGELVPDEMIIKLISTELKSIDTSIWLLDGFPRNAEQAKKLNELVQIDYVVNLDVPHDVVVSRVSSRWIHEPSGRVYNTGYHPPKVPGKDDVTGEDLMQ